MEFQELVEVVGVEPVFESGLLLSGNINLANIRRQLSRWKNTGKIYQIRRGIYTLAPPFQKVKPHPFLVANRMVSASYVSLQSALAYYGMIPEFVPVTTSVTTGRPEKCETPLGNFDFRHVQVAFFNGYDYIDLGENQRAFIATPEKAILDLLYLQPAGDTIDYILELRLENLDQLDWLAFEKMVNQFGKPKLERAASHIAKLIAEEKEYEGL